MPINYTEYARQCCERGMTLVQARRLDEAMAEFSDALRVDPGSADARYGLGECLVRRGRLDVAMERYLECLQINPGHIQARYGLGQAYLTKGKISEAISHFTTVRVADPGHVQAMFHIGRCLEKNGQIAGALQEYRSIVLRFPDFIDAYMAAASCLITLGRERDAAKEYRKAIARYPDRMDIREALISLLEREGYFETAIVEYRKIQAMRPGDIEVRLRIASAMDRGGMIRDSIEEYARVLEMSPLNSFARIKQNILLAERDKIDRLADRYLGQVINRMETIGDHFREGMKLYLEGGYDVAIVDFEIEIESGPSHDACFAIGACLVRTGNLLAAVPRFREAIRLKADFPEAHTMLGVLYERHGLLYESLEEYSQGVSEAQEQARTNEQMKGKSSMMASDPSFKFYRLA